MTIAAGSLVTLKGGDGTQLLVTSVGGGYAPANDDGTTPTPRQIAYVQWWDASAELHTTLHLVDDLELQVPALKREHFTASLAQADYEAQKAEGDAAFAALVAANEAEAKAIDQLEAQVAAA